MAWPSSITAAPSKRLATNGSAWIGLAASYDRLGRFDLADLAYRHAIRLDGENYIILNNRGYSYLLRGDVRRARRLLERAMLLAPGDPTIANNIAVMDAGLAFSRLWALRCSLGAGTLARFPITWNRLIEKEALEFKDLVHVGIEKVEQLLRDLRPRSLRFLVPTVSWVTNSF